MLFKQFQDIMGLVMIWEILPKTFFGKKHQKLRIFRTVDSDFCQECASQSSGSTNVHVLIFPTWFSAHDTYASV